MSAHFGWSGFAAVALAAFLTAANPLAAQDWMRSQLDSPQRLDLRELGYPLINEIAANNTAVTSLITARDGKIYGATSGDTAYLFVFDPQINKVRHLGRVEDRQSVHHALAQDRDGIIYLGTGLNPFIPVELSSGGIVGHVDKTLWQDIRDHFKDFPGGHLYAYDPKKSDAVVKLAGQSADLTDLGIPVANNSIYCLAADLERGRLYGVSYPDGKFFYYDISGKSFKVVGDIDNRVVFHGPERDWRSLPRALHVDAPSGRVFTSGNEGNLAYYCPRADSLFQTGIAVPGNRHHGQANTYPVVECFARGEEGWVYGGASDGHLFRFRPASLELHNLGKPRSERRLRCLAVAADGNVYLLAGERKGAIPCKMFRYDPRTGSYRDLGMLVVDRSPHYHRRGYQFDAMATGADGTIYLGESERASSLWLFFP